MASEGATYAKRVELDSRLVDWYYATYPDGSLSWILNLLMNEFMEVSKTKTPAYYAALGAAALTEQLNSD